MDAFFVLDITYVRKSTHVLQYGFIWGVRAVTNQ